jgi:uncharacterized protein YbjT (DUF2867 family)
VILVTGATGRPGSAVIREFARRREPVRALVRDRSKAEALRALPEVEVTYGDMLWPETLGDAFAGVDRVLMISNAGPQMLETQATFIDAARKAGVGHIVKFSGEDSARGFDPEKFRSTRSHEQIQRYLMASGVPWTMLRPSQFMQVYFEEVPTIATVGELRLPLGSATLAPVDIDDVAKVAYAVLTTPGHGGKTYKVTGPEALTAADIAQAISDAIAKPVRHVDVTPEQKHQEWIAAGYPPVRADAFIQLFNERRVLAHSDVHLATHETFGIEPTTFARFALKHAAVFRGDAAYSLTPV